MRDDLTSMTPRLRRYARALATGSAEPSDLADTLVHATLMRAMGARSLGSLDLSVRLFATVTQMHRDLAPAERGELAVGGARRAPASTAAPVPTNRLAAALLRLAVEEREALLLVALEGFDHGTAARILRLSRPVLIERLTRARVALDRCLAGPSPAATAGPAPRAPHLRLVVG